MAAAEATADPSFTGSQFYPQMTLVRPIFYEKGLNPLSYRDMIALEIMDTNHDFAPGIQKITKTIEQFIHNHIKQLLIDGHSSFYLPDYSSSQPTPESLGGIVGDCPPSWENIPRSWAFLRGCKGRSDNPVSVCVPGIIKKQDPCYNYIQISDEPTFVNYIQETYNNTHLGNKLEKLIVKNLSGQSPLDLLQSFYDTNQLLMKPAITLEFNKTDLNAYLFVEKKDDVFLSTYKQSDSGILNRDILSKFLAKYLTGSENTSMYFTHDSTGGGKIPDLFALNAENMHTLITPQNLYDSASNYKGHFRSQQTKYYFPYTHMHSHNQKAFVSRRNIYTGNFYQCIYTDHDFDAEDESDITRDCYGRFQYHIRDRTHASERQWSVNMKELGYAVPKNGPSIEYLSDLIKQFMDNNSLTSDKIAKILHKVPPSSGVYPFIHYAFSQNNNMLIDFIEKMKENKNAFFLDAKRCGDQDQVDAAYLSSLEPSMKGKVVLVTGDLLCSLYARLYSSLHVIYVHAEEGKNVMDIYRSSESIVDLTPNEIKAIEIKKKIGYIRYYYKIIHTILVNHLDEAIYRVLQMLMQCGDQNVFCGILLNMNGVIFSQDTSDKAMRQFKLYYIIYCDMLLFYKMVFDTLRKLREISSNPDIQVNIHGLEDYYKSSIADLADISQDDEQKIDQAIKIIKERMFPVLSDTDNLPNEWPINIKSLENLMNELLENKEELLSSAIKYYHFAKAYVKSTMEKRPEERGDEIFVEIPRYEQISRREGRWRGMGPIEKKQKDAISYIIDIVVVRIGNINNEQRAMKNHITYLLSLFKNPDISQKSDMEDEKQDANLVKDGLSQLKDISSSHYIVKGGDITKKEALKTIFNDEDEIKDLIKSLNEAVEETNKTIRNNKKSLVDILTYLQDVFLPYYAPSFISTNVASLTNEVKENRLYKQIMSVFDQELSPFKFSSELASYPLSSSQLVGGGSKNSIIPNIEYRRALYDAHKNEIDVIGSDIVRAIVSVASEERNVLEDHLKQYKETTDGTMLHYIDNKVLLDYFYELSTKSLLAFYGENYRNNIEQVKDGLYYHYGDSIHDMIGEVNENISYLQDLDGIYHYLTSLLFSIEKVDQIVCLIVFPILYILSSKQMMGSRSLNFQSSFVKDLLYTYFPDQFNMSKLYYPISNLSDDFSWSDMGKWIKGIHTSIYNIYTPSNVKRQTKNVSIKGSIKKHSLHNTRRVGEVIGGSLHKKTRKQHKKRSNLKKQQKVKSFKSNCRKASQFLKKTRSRK